MKIPYTISTINLLNVDFTRKVLFQFSFIWEINGITCEISGPAVETVTQAKEAAVRVINAINCEPIDITEY